LKNTALIAVAQANTEPWITIKNEGQEKTWIAIKINGIDTIYFKSKSKWPITSRDAVYLNVFKLYPNMAYNLCTSTKLCEG
jgi:hypothetical protein